MKQNRLHPQLELLNTWAIDHTRFSPDATKPPLCLRCGQPLSPILSHNALSRYEDVHICAVCGMDEAIGDATQAQKRFINWAAVAKRWLKAPAENDQFMHALFSLPEMASLETMRRMCRVYAEPTSDPTEFNLYCDTDHFHVWLRLITRERDYSLYVHYQSCHRL